jgi:kinesin family protein C1
MTRVSSAAKESLEASRAEALRLHAELEATKSILAKTRADAEATKEALDSSLAIAQAKLATAEEKLAQAAVMQQEWESKCKALSAEKEELLTYKSGAEETMSSLNQELETLRESAGVTHESQLEKLCQVSKEADTLRRRLREMAEVKARLAESEATVAKLKEDVFSGEMARRILHNQVQDLKGNIRVYVRVRPFLANDNVPLEDGSPADAPAINCALDGSSLDIVPPQVRSTKDSSLGVARKPAPPMHFSFDTVFGPRCGQDDVFNEVSNLVQSALDGYNVCLFSYGQTGSGKTHTMQGGQGPDAGLIPRSVKKILETAVMMGNNGWKYTIDASFLEIYNEAIRDLLRIKKDDEPMLAIHQDAEGNPEVPGLTRVPVSEHGTIDQLLQRAAKRRAVAATTMNEQSSRSHQVFTLYIRGEHAGKGIAVCGSLNLCDLAGSERLSRSNAEGDRKKETAAINKSLSCLADVFTALAKKAPHIPFRNSKLTHLLQPCFKGEGKTLMLVNLSPTQASAQESLCSLRFAAQVSQVELGKATKKVMEAATAEVPGSVYGMPPTAPMALENGEYDRGNASYESSGGMDEEVGYDEAAEGYGDSNGLDGVDKEGDEDELENALDLNHSFNYSGTQRLSGSKRPIAAISSSQSSNGTSMARSAGPSALAAAGTGASRNLGGLASTATASSRNIGMSSALSPTSKRNLLASSKVGGTAVGASMSSNAASSVRRGSAAVTPSAGAGMVMQQTLAKKARTLK